MAENQPTTSFNIETLGALSLRLSDHNLQSLGDLVELRAVEHRTPLARLWERVFAAIRDGKLDFGFPDEFEPAYGSLKHRIPIPRPWEPDDVPESHIETLCKSALSAIKNCDAFPPWGQLWVRRMLVSAAAFDKALFPAHQTRGNESALVAEIEKRLSAGEIPGVTVRWNKFCDAVRDATDGWIDRKKREAKRGYGEKTIQLVVRRVRVKE
jgi:hypothetical protein